MQLSSTISYEYVSILLGTRRGGHLQTPWTLSCAEKSSTRERAYPLAIRLSPPTGPIDFMGRHAADRQRAGGVWVATHAVGAKHANTQCFGATSRSNQVCFDAVSFIFQRYSSALRGRGTPVRQAVHAWQRAAASRENTVWRPSFYRR
jgi:hypothetical protein